MYLQLSLGSAKSVCAKASASKQDAQEGMLILQNPQHRHGCNVDDKMYLGGKAEKFIS